MEEKYDLKELLLHPDTPLTSEQYAHWHRYMAMTNDDIPADEVDIGPAVQARIDEIEEKGTCWF